VNNLKKSNSPTKAKNPGAGAFASNTGQAINDTANILPFAQNCKPIFIEPPDNLEVLQIVAAPPGLRIIYQTEEGISREPVNFLALTRKFSDGRYLFDLTPMARASHGFILALEYSNFIGMDEELTGAE
jgi:hypothetical protein